MTEQRATRGKPAQPAPGLATDMDAQAEAAAELLKAMSNPQRLRVLCLLLEGERSVGEINERINLSQSALSQHLAMLRESALVKTRRQAQTVYSSVGSGPVHDIIQTLHAIYCSPPKAAQARTGVRRGKS